MEPHLIRGVFYAYIFGGIKKEENILYAGNRVRPSVVFLFSPRRDLLLLVVFINKIKL